VAILARGYAAELVLTHGKIVTLDPRRPQAEAVAMAGGRIVAIGNSREIAAQAGGAKVIDLGGHLAIPGFIEGHGHFLGLGQFKMNLNLSGARSWDEIVAMVAAAAKEAKPGAWIVGRGWHQEKWDRAPEPNVEGFPLEASLSRVSPRNPVLLTHASGHGAFANAAALKLGGVTAKTPNPAGGEILHDAHGNPTGMLRETAQNLVRKALPAPTEADDRRAIEYAIKECLAKGITTFQDAGSAPETIELVRRTLGGRLRLWMMLRVPNSRLAPILAQATVLYNRSGGTAQLSAGPPAIDPFLTVRAIKRQIDGALGSRGAWLLAPYTDLPSSAGLNTEDPADIEKTAELAIAAGYQLCVHAIGDRANREVLDIYERVFRRHPDKKDLRWRIEHAQHLSAADIPRFAKLGVIASMQGIHCTSDAPYVLARLGPKRAEEGAYVWQKLLHAGAVVSNGTDAPVEDVSPIASYYATVSRRLKDGTVFYPDQRMSRMEALRSYTASNAYAGFEEKTKGTLKVAMLADITVLSKDILTIAEADIPSTEVLYTIVDGRVQYQK
jgi:predicted amidohydrolase YtcJ